MLVVKRLGDIDRYKVSVDDLFDNKPPNSVNISNNGCKCEDEYYYGCDYMMHEHKHHHHKHNHHNKPIPHYPPVNHSDHYIESQHHAKGEHIHRKPTHTTHNKPVVHKPDNYYKEHPKRVIRPLEPFERPFPRQEVMLLDISTDIKRSIVIDFKYNTCVVTKEISEGDIVHAYYIDRGNLENQLTEITGKVTYIDFNNMKIYIDYSSNYEANKVDIYVNMLRFISVDLYEVAPFFEQEEVYDEPLIEEPVEDILPPIEEIDPDYDVDSNLDYVIDSSLFVDKGEEEQPEEDLPTEEVIPSIPEFPEEDKEDNIPKEEPIQPEEDLPTEEVVPTNPNVEEESPSNDKEDHSIEDGVIDDNKEESEIENDREESETQS